MLTPPSSCPSGFEGFSQDSDLSIYHPKASSSNGVPFLYTRLKIENLFNIILELVAQPLKFRQRQFRDLNIFRLC